MKFFNFHFPLNADLLKKNEEFGGTKKIPGRCGAPGIFCITVVSRTPALSGSVGKLGVMR